MYTRATLLHVITPLPPRTYFVSTIHYTILICTAYYRKSLQNITVHAVPFPFPSRRFTLILFPSGDSVTTWSYASTIILYDIFLFHFKRWRISLSLPGKMLKMTYRQTFCSVIWPCYNMFTARQYDFPQHIVKIQNRTAGRSITGTGLRTKRR